MTVSRGTVLDQGRAARGCCHQLAKHSCAGSIRLRLGRGKQGQPVKRFLIECLCASVVHANISKGAVPAGFGRVTARDPVGAKVLQTCDVRGDNVCV